MTAQNAKFTSVEAVLGFVTRTMERGVPLRVALMRAERRYGIDRGFIRQFLRGQR